MRVQACLQGVVGGTREVPRQLGGGSVGGLEALAHAEAPQLQCVVQRLLQPHVEPGIDRGVEEVQGEAAHHDHRRQRQQHQHGEQAPRQARAGHVAAYIARQAQQALHDDQHEHKQGRGRYAKQPRVPGGIAVGAAGRVKLASSRALPESSARAPP